MQAQRRFLPLLGLAMLLAVPSGINAQQPQSAPPTGRDTVRHLPRDTAYVVIVPQQKRDTSSVHLIPLQSREGEGSWFVNQFIRTPISVAIANATTMEACERQKVRFIFQHAGTASDPGPKVKEVNPDFRLDVTGQPVCVADVYWRLGDMPGEQLVEAELVRADGAIIAIPEREKDQARAQFRATAHPPPGIILGLAYLSTELRRADLDEDDGASGQDTTTKIQQIIGVEFPLLFRLLPTTRFPFLDHIRVTAATSLKEPGEDLYMGLQLGALLGGPRSASFPIQLSVGYRLGDQTADSWFLAAHGNVTAALASLLPGLSFR